jgi:2-C-methyl-D-erythritol 4-phosphate cytidylyltransferase
VTKPAEDVEAIIQAAGRGTRLGLGPKAFVELGGNTLLERAVATMLTVVARVIVAVPLDGVERAERLVGGEATTIVAGGARRPDTLRALVDAATAPWLLLHDVVHPFVTSELARRVMAEGRRAGAAAPALPNREFLYATDGVHRAAPGEIMATQKPLAFRRETMLRGFEIADRSGDGVVGRERGSQETLALAGQRVSFVLGQVKNCKLTTLEDLELARLIAAGND